MRKYFSLLSMSYPWSTCLVLQFEDKYFKSITDGLFFNLVYSLIDLSFDISNSAAKI